jgi:diacylglycerol kinase (ATP)
MQVALIHNKGAGDPDEHSKDRLLALIRDAGHDVTYFSSKKKKEWREALGKGWDLVAVAGGDGTVGRVARRLAGCGSPGAVLPLGTANNVARALGVADTPVEALVAGWTSADRCYLDLGMARGPWGERRFVEGVGAGLLARMMSWLETVDNAPLDHLDDADERVASVVRMLRARLDQCRPAAYTVTLDGRDCSGEYVLVEAMNIPTVGPNLRLAPEASPTDGLLDVVLLSEKDRAEFREHLRSFFPGHNGAPALTVERARRIEIAWDGFDVHIDDEPWPEEGEDPPARPSTIVVTLENCAMEFLVPKAGTPKTGSG